MYWMITASTQHDVASKFMDGFLKNPLFVLPTMFCVADMQFPRKDMEC